MSHTSRASALADTTDLAYQAAVVAARCRTTGLDPRTYRGAVGCAITLGRDMFLINGPAWESDHELLSALASLDWGIIGKQTALRHARASTRASHAAARDAAWAQMVMHGHTTPNLRARLNDCATALAIIERARAQLRYAQTRLSAVPADLGETYQAAYALISRGQVMPFDGRWLTGTGC